MSDIKDGELSLQDHWLNWPYKFMQCGCCRVQKQLITTAASQDKAADLYEKN